jgi:hypothetical protein
MNVFLRNNQSKGAILLLSPLSKQLHFLEGRGTVHSLAAWIQKVNYNPKVAFLAAQEFKVDHLTSNEVQCCQVLHEHFGFGLIHDEGEYYTMSVPSNPASLFLSKMHTKTILCNLESFGIRDQNIDYWLTSQSK